MKILLSIAVLLATVLVGHAQMEKADPSKVKVATVSNDRALLKAAEACDLAAVTKLLKDGADANAVDRGQQRTPLIWAASCQEPKLAEVSVQVVKALLAGGAKVNQATTEGNTALWCAAARGNMGVVRALLAAGADPTIVGQDKQTPADIAAAKGFTATAQLLRDSVSVPAVTPLATK